MECSISVCQICETNIHASIIMDLGDYAISRCSKCGFVYVNGDRSLSASRERYKKDLFEEGGYLQFYDIRKIAEEQLESTILILRRAGTDLEQIPVESPILDIGCARGHFLNSMSKLRPKENLIGCDTSDNMISWGVREFGLDLRTTCIEDAPFPPNYFGLITGFDVLEHVPFPRMVKGNVNTHTRWLVYYRGSI